MGAMATTEASAVPDFHELLMRAFQASGMDQNRFSRAMGGDWVRQILRGRTRWPAPERLRHLCMMLAAPPAWVDAWMSQAEASWPSATKVKMGLVDLQASFSPKTAIGWFLYRKWQSSGKGMNAFARDDLGVAFDTFQRLLTGHRPVKRTYGRLKRVYGDELPPAELHRDWLRKQSSTQMRAARKKLDQKKAAEGRRGKPRSPEATARMLATKAKSGEDEREKARLIAFAKSLKGRAVASLKQYLEWTPAPSKETIEAWAQTVGERLVLPTAAVKAIWRPYLQKRRLWPKGGRPAKYDLAQVFEWRHQKPIIKWEAIRSRLKLSEDELASLRRAYYRYVRKG
jgi:hypothetical protein